MKNKLKGDPTNKIHKTHMVSIGTTMWANLKEHAKGGASRSGKTTCSNAGTLVPRKVTKGV
jgi:hypothetical protein